MAGPAYIPLRIHSAYSLSEGALKIPQIVQLCVANAIPAAAIADTNNLFGALEFSAACKEAGIQPIVGCQLSLRVAARSDRSGAHLKAEPVVALAKDAAGFGNLMKLASRAHLTPGPGEPAHVDLEALESLSDGLILLTGGAGGPVGALLQNGQLPAAEELLRRFKSVFADRLYVEVARIGRDAERRIEGALIDLADRHALPLVATNEAFFGDATLYEAHDALLCIAAGAFVAEPNRRRLSAEHRFRSPEEMRDVFSDLPEALANTVAIARRCSVMAEARKPILPSFATEAGRSEAEELRVRAEAGLEARLERHVLAAGADGTARAAAAQPYRDRLAFEIKVIADMGFPGYFLIVADFINWAKANGIPVGPGRGSGAGSVAAWALGITDLDPLRWGLLFERFLNPERVSMPDFDIDFCQDRRDEVIRYVREKYGSERVAQIITFGKLQARAVLRDVGRVLQMPYGQVDKLCKLVPYNPANPVTLQQAIDGEPILQESRRSDEAVAHLIDIALNLEGLYRHASTHAAGVVIGDRPLEELIPLYRDHRSGDLVTQYNMKDVEKAGLVKFDFLGLTTLSLLAHAVELAAKRGAVIDLLTLPLDDKATWDMLAGGDTTGVFQLESGGMRNAVRSLKPDRFEDLIALVALYRPGPMDNIPSYVNRKHGREKADYLHPLLEPILRETHGIIIYQEQVMQIAQVLSGYSLGGADLLRRAMGKKIKSEMEGQRAVFAEGAARNNVDPERAATIFDLVEKFAGYGFNKSHAAAYALVAFQTAYLKANHPVEFFAASMTYTMHSTEKLATFRRELTRRGIDVLPPDVNRSEPRFSVEDGAVRYALAAIKNVGEQAMQAVLQERVAHGRFKSAADFARRLDSSVVNRRQLENLVKAGAFDSIDRNRRRLFEGIDAILKLAGASAAERDSRQVSLFGDMTAMAADRLQLPDVPDWNESDRLRHEYEAIGFYLSAHPLDGQDKLLARLGVTRYADLAARAAQGVSALPPRLAGIAIGYRVRTSAKGSRYAVIQMSDTTGMFEVWAFNEILSANRDLIDEAAAKAIPLYVEADLQKGDDGEIRLFVRALRPLDAAAKAAPQIVRVFVDSPEAVRAVGAIVEKERGGKGQLRLIVPRGEEEVEIGVPGNFGMTIAVQQALKSIPGVIHIEQA